MGARLTARARGVKMLGREAVSPGRGDFEECTGGAKVSFVKGRRALVPT